MALIKVGIHENLVLSPKTKINEHGTLELVIATKDDNNSLLNAFTSNSTLSSMESSIRFYPPNLKDFDQALKSSAEIAKDLLLIRHQFMQYGLVFTTKEKVEEAIGGIKMFDGLGIAPENIGNALNMLNKEEFLLKVMANLSKRFLGLLQSVNAFSGTTSFRQKFLRQSKDKNYAVVPTSDFDTWIEPMSIPASASKIAYSKWEIENGKNNPDPVAGDTSQQNTAEAEAKAASLFSTPAPAAALTQDSDSPFTAPAAVNESPTPAPAASNFFASAPVAQDGTAPTVTQ